MYGCVGNAEVSYLILPHEAMMLSSVDRDEKYASLAETAEILRADAVFD